MPRPRSTSMVNSGARIACAAAGIRSPCPTPPSTRCTPPTETATRAGSTSAPDRPTAARIRPQLGSMPWAAVFTSGEVVIASPARRASSSLAAPMTVTAITLVAPSPSRTIWWARCWVRATSASRNSAYPGSSGERSNAAPAAPVASRKIVSLVLVSPSTLIRLKDRPTAKRSARWSSGGSTAASVVTSESVVAMRGWIIPAPLAMPPSVTACPPISIWTAPVLGNASVVRIASAACSPCGPSDAASAGIPLRSRSLGSGTPIPPVLATSTRAREMPRARATRSTISHASRRPCSPVQALALPLLITTAWARPPWTCSRLTSTGAACTRFVVKQAAAAARAAVTTNAQSGRPPPVQPPHEGRAAIGLAEGRLRRFPGDGARGLQVDGRQNAAGHRDQVRREGEAHLAGKQPQFLLDLAAVAVSRRGVGEDVLVALEKVGAAGGGASRARDAGLRVDDDRGRPGQPGPQQRRDRQQRGRRVAAGVADDAGATDLRAVQLRQPVGRLFQQRLRDMWGLVPALVGRRPAEE